jgi:hypothetical protein
MQPVFHNPPRPNRVLLALLVTLASATALAAGKPPSSDARVRYQRESAACAAIRDFDNRANCLSEASTRFASTTPLPPEEAPDILLRNALMRCQPLPEPLRADCVARMQGSGTTSGSVDAGGIYRELVTREVGVAPAPAPPAVPQ